MRQAINNLQSTWSGFDFVSPENVFKVCDQPHPVLAKQIVANCLSCDVDKSMALIEELYNQGFSCVDIVTTLFKVVKTFEMQEFNKLEFIKVILTTT